MLCPPWKDEPIAQRDVKEKSKPEFWVRKENVSPEKLNHNPDCQDILESSLSIYSANPHVKNKHFLKRNKYFTMIERLSALHRI